MKSLGRGFLEEQTDPGEQQDSAGRAAGAVP